MNTKNGMNEKIKSLLKELHEMSQGEDWDESSAQSLIVYGGELYEEYLKDKWDTVLNSEKISTNVENIVLVESEEKQPYYEPNWIVFPTIEEMNLLDKANELLDWYDNNHDKVYFGVAYHGRMGGWTVAKTRNEYPTLKRAILEAMKLEKHEHTTT